MPRLAVHREKLMRGAGRAMVAASFGLLVAAGACLAGPPSVEATHDRPADAPKFVPEAFVCRMHPQVRAPREGRCPICHMALDPVYKRDGLTVGAGAHGDHNAKHGGIFTMLGDYHLEFAELDKEFRVYVYDQFTVPMPAETISGTVAYSLRSGRTGAAPEVTRPLAPAADGGHLAAPRPPADDPDEVRVDVAVRGERLSVTFPLKVTLEGEIIDPVCYVSQAQGGLSTDLAECSRQRLKAGAPACLLAGDDSTAFVYLLVGREPGSWYRVVTGQLAPLAGRRVRAAGKLLQRGSLQLFELHGVALEE